MRDKLQNTRQKTVLRIPDTFHNLAFSYIVAYNSIELK